MDIYFNTIKKKKIHIYVAIALIIILIVSGVIFTVQSPCYQILFGSVKGRIQIFVDTLEPMIDLNYSANKGNAIIELPEKALVEADFIDLNGNNLTVNIKGKERNVHLCGVGKEKKEYKDVYGNQTVYLYITKMSKKGIYAYVWLSEDIDVNSTDEVNLYQMMNYRLVRYGYNDFKRSSDGYYDGILRTAEKNSIY